MKIRFLLLILFFVLPMITIRAENTDFFVCDVDLVSDDGAEFYRPWKPTFLRDECQAVYAKKTTDPKGYKLYEDEANAFRNFLAAIEQYEDKKAGQELCANEKYPLYTQDRMKFYKRVNMCDCYKMNNKESFLHCLVQRRKELVEIINEARDSL